MALDWNKEISLGVKKSGKRAKGSEYPSKTHMNLAINDGSDWDFKKAMPLAIILLIVVILFLKFGVLDFIGQMNAKTSELTTQQQLLDTANQKLKNYDAVEAEYESYGSYALSGDIAEARTVFSIIDSQVAPYATVSSVSFQNNIITLAISNTTLDTVGALNQSLSSLDTVSNVAVSTAATDSANASNVNAVMVITMAKAQS